MVAQGLKFRSWFLVFHTFPRNSADCLLEKPGHYVWGLSEWGNSVYSIVVQCHVTDSLCLMLLCIPVPDDLLVSRTHLLLGQRPWIWILAIKIGVKLWQALNGSMRVWTLRESYWKFALGDDILWHLIYPLQFLRLWKWYTCIKRTQIVLL